MAPFAGRLAPAAIALALAAIGLGVVFDAGAQGLKPEPWKPKPPETASGDSSRGERPLELPTDVRRMDDLFYQPNVPDSLLPFVPAWLEVSTEEGLSGYQGTLRQGSPERFFPIVLPNQVAHAQVDGGAHGAQLAVVLFLPWLGEFVREPYTTAEVVHRMDNGPEQKAKLPFFPGPVLFSQGLPRPVPVSAPGLLTVQVPPGRHRLAIKVRDMKALYMFMLLGQMRPAPLPVVRDS